jgi:hypothetical protein
MIYFAYGANLNIDNMNSRCPDAIPLCNIQLPDYRLVFRGVADIEPCSNQHVQGLLWHITDKCEQSLDIFEGFPHLYRKENFVVQFHQPELIDTFGDVVDVMFYTMNRNGYASPSYGYYETIKQGYQDNNLIVDKLEEAVDHSLNSVDEPYISNQWG